MDMFKLDLYIFWAVFLADIEFTTIWVSISSSVGSRTIRFYSIGLQTLLSGYHAEQMHLFNQGGDDDGIKMLTNYLRY